MTMSSFNSLSLDPPVVTFHVATPSRTLDAVKECGQFNVHILAGDMGGAKVADWFTRGNLKDGLWETEGLESVGVRIEKGTGDGETPEPPVLQSKGVLYVLKCRLLDEEHGGVVMVRDHAIVLGEVEGILEGSARFHTEERFGLVYADRRYRQLGNTLVKIPAEGDGRKTG
jgi:flavin reductase (DIM6/NTAB) family NADH-FMN oxidoreductase RutF